MPKYKKCPRCDLNYILEEEEYCKICQEELRGISHNTEDLDEEIEERNNQWRSGIRSIRKRLSLTEIDEATATGEAIKLANKLKREFVAWLGEN